MSTTNRVQKLIANHQRSGKYQTYFDLVLSDDEIQEARMLGFYVENPWTAFQTGWPGGNRVPGRIFRIEPKGSYEHY